MHTRTFSYYSLLVIFAGVFAAMPITAISAQNKKALSQPLKVTKQKLVIQVSDADPKKWTLALNNAANVQEDLGKEMST